jgi:O-antigen/teichoic acid export membrane protein
VVVKNEMIPDLRKYRRQTNTRLILGALIILFIIGDGLIYLFYGPNAGIMGLLCIGIGLIPIASIYIFLWVIDLIVKKSNQS